MEQINYTTNTATTAQIIEHLNLCNNFFVPKLSTKVSIDEYATKLKTNAINFEAWHNNQLIGLVAVYQNSTENFMYISNVSVLPNYFGQKISWQLMSNLITYATTQNIKKIKLEVNKNNNKAINLYKKLNFEEESQNNESFFLNLNLHE